MRYVAEVVGSGSDEDPRRPDVPDGIAWRTVEALEDGSVVIETDAELDLPLADGTLP